MDRPARKTKVVNYSEAKDLDDDEDFASAKAPPSKRAKGDVQPGHKKPSSMPSHRESDSQSAVSQKSRKPLDEKVHKRDLEAAITLSLLNNGGGIKDQPTAHGDVKSPVPVDENTDPTSAHLSNCSVDLTVWGLDTITLEKESTAHSRERKSASRAPEEQKSRPAEEEEEEDDDDEDYEPKLTPESESNDDFNEPGESEEEEFTVKKFSKKKKEKRTKTEKTKPPPPSKEEKQPSKTAKSKTPTVASTPTRSPPAAKLAPKKPAPSSTASPPGFPLSPAGGGRIPKWNPPAQVGRSPSSSSPALKSPGQGLRLGLSRRVRVKPLHPGVSSH
ncbi:RAD51-associated protein 1 isoform 2-T3 [Spinachia spinachia]